MKKLVLLIAMMLAIAGVVDAQVNYTVQTRLQKDYFKVELSITSGTAPFDVIFNGRHVGFYGMYGAYDTINILTVRDANNQEKTDTIFEADPHFVWSINYFFCRYAYDFTNIEFQETGINIGCSFSERYNFDIKWYRASDNTEIGCGVNYEPVPDSIRTFLHYQADDVPVGIYAIKIRDTIHNMDTVVFVEITSTTVDTTTTDTTATDTTTTDTTQHLTITITEKIDNVAFYPNPTSDICNTSEVLREVCIFSNEGKLVRKFTYTNRLDLTGLPAGVYLIRYIKTDGTIDTERIIKRI